MPGSCKLVTSAYTLPDYRRHLSRRPTVIYRIFIQRCIGPKACRQQRWRVSGTGALPTLECNVLGLMPMLTLEVIRDTRPLISVSRVGLFDQLADEEQLNVEHGVALAWVTRCI